MVVTPPNRKKVRGIQGGHAKGTGRRKVHQHINRRGEKKHEKRRQNNLPPGTAIIINTGFGFNLSNSEKINGKIPGGRPSKFVNRGSYSSQYDLEKNKERKVWFRSKIGVENNLGEKNGKKPWKERGTGGEGRRGKRNNRVLPAGEGGME